MSDESTNAGALTAMRLPELKQLAKELGVPSVSTKRKPELIAAISAIRVAQRQKAAEASASTVPTERGEDAAAARRAPARRQAASEVAAVAPAPQETAPQPHSEPAHSEGVRLEASSRGERAGRLQRAEHDVRRRTRRGVSAPAAEPGEAPLLDVKSELARTREEAATRPERRLDQDAQRALEQVSEAAGERRQQRRERDRDRDRERDDERGGRSRRNRRDRNKRRGRGDVEVDIEISEDDVLIPIAGILDVQDNHAFVRTSGYLPGPKDVYVTMNQVRRNGLRPGDAVQGAIRAPRDGESQPTSTQ